MNIKQLNDIDACVFDAYGTLCDFTGVTGRRPERNQAAPAAASTSLA